VREAASHGGAIALDDEVEVAPHDRRAAPQVPDEPSHEERAAVMFLRDPADRGEQFPHVHREVLIHSAGGRGVGQPGASESATDRAARTLRAAHRDEGSTRDEQAAHGRLACAWFNGGKRARDLHRAQHVRRARREQASVPPAHERQRVGHRDSCRRHRDHDVDEVGRLEVDLWIHVRPLRHAHARGWKRRYICRTAVDGRCV